MTEKPCAAIWTSHCSRVRSDRALHSGKAERSAVVLVVHAEQPAGRRARAARQRHVGDEIVVGAELLLLLGAGLLAGAVLRRAAMDRIALADQHLRVVSGRDVVLVVSGASDLGEGQRRRAVRAGLRTRADRAAAEKPECATGGHALQHSAARQPRVDDPLRSQARPTDSRTSRRALRMGRGSCAVSLRSICRFQLSVISILLFGALGGDCVARAAWSA